MKIDKISWLAAKIAENWRQKYGQDEERERSIFSSEMEVAKLSAAPSLEVSFDRDVGNLSESLLTESELPLQLKFEV